MRHALLCLLIACGGSSKPAQTTPKAPAGSGSSADPSTMQNTPAPDNGGGSAQANDTTPTPQAQDNTPPEPQIQYPNYDPDPAQVKTQVDAQLQVAKNALSQQPPDAEAARLAARKALDLDAANLDAAAYLAYAFYAKKQYDTAELVLDDVFKRPSAKENANVFYVYGLVYDHTNRPEQAVLAFQKAVAINPNFQSAQVDLGVHQLENKQYAEAQQTFEKLTAAGRNDAVTLTSLGSAYRGHSGDFAPGSNERNQLVQQAETAYKKAIQLDPNNGPAYYNLSLLYLDTDPYPGLDTIARLNAAKTYMDTYKNMPGVDMKLYDQRNKEIDKAIKRAQKQSKKKAGGKGGGNP